MNHDKIIIPDGDLLLHTGDMTNSGSKQEIKQVNDWLGSLPHKHKVIIAGNHDFLFENNNADARALITNAHYLQDSMVEIDKVKIYGSPWQPWFYDWAFNLRRGQPLRNVWSKIPAGIDILMTHGPPFGVLDYVTRAERVGCEDLINELFRVKPKLHVFGHIHESYGETFQHGIHFVNASMCSVNHRSLNEPIVVDLEIE